MEFELNKAYALSNLSFQSGGFNVNDVLIFSRSYYYKNENEQFTNVRKLSFVSDTEVDGYGYVDEAIILQDGENNIVDLIRVNSVQRQVRNAYYLTFVVATGSELQNTYTWLTSCGIREIAVDTINSSLSLFSGVSGNPTRFHAIKDGVSYDDMITGLGEVISDITLSPFQNYSLYQRPIKVFTYPISLNVGWDNTQPKLNITPVVLDGDVIKIGDIPFERTTDTTPPGNLESFRIECDAYNLANQLYIFIGDPTSSEDGRISLVNGEPEEWINAIYGEDTSFSLTLDGEYHFTEDSPELIKQWLIELVSYEDIEVTMVDYTELQVTFKKLTRNIDNEDFGIYVEEALTSDNRTIEQVRVEENPTIHTNLIGCQLYNIETGEEVVDGSHIPYGTSLNLRYNALSGYEEDDERVNVFGDNIDITHSSNVRIDDASILIEEVTYARVDVSVLLTHLHEVNFILNGSVVFTKNTTSGILSFTKESGDNYAIRFLTGAGGSTLIQIPLQTGKEVKGITKNGKMVVPLNYALFVNLEDYATDYVVNFDITIGNIFEESFTLELMTYSGELNAVNKDPFITNNLSLNGTLRESCSVIDPVITFEYDGDITKFNYAYIPQFKRYYFIKDVTIINKNLYQISMHVDVLYSYRFNILSQHCIVARNEFTYDLKVKDDTRAVSQEYDYSVVDIRASNYPLQEYKFDGLLIAQVIRGIY